MAQLKLEDIVKQTKERHRDLGKPYIWGGNDPMQGFDCSGFVVELLKSVGILPRYGDWTAQGLWDKFGMFEYNNPELIEPGDLVFWHSKRNSSRIVHVEILINKNLSIGASGGGSENATLQDAIDRDAYVKIRPYTTRPHMAGFAKIIQKG